MLLAEGGVQLGQRPRVARGAQLLAGDLHRLGDGVGDLVLVRQAHLGDHLAQPAAPLGVLGARGLRWSLPAALATTGLLALVFAWRASVGWLAIIDGKREKLFAASLITLMLAASVLMLLCLLKARKTGDAEKPDGTPS